MSPGRILGRLSSSGLQRCAARFSSQQQILRQPKSERAAWFTADRCEDIPGWVDKDGYSCSSYAALQWCCAPNTPHCNAEFANSLGQDSDDACCATCSAPCVDDDALMVLSYGYDCATVLARDECGTLRDAGLEMSCGCTCRESEGNLHGACLGCHNFAVSRT